MPRSALKMLRSIVEVHAIRIAKADPDGKEIEFINEAALSALEDLGKALLKRQGRKP